MFWCDFVYWYLFYYISSVGILLNVRGFVKVGSSVGEIGNSVDFCVLCR